MPKSKTIFFCKECGYESSKWTGQCPSCKAWNSMTEAPSVRRKDSGLRNDSLNPVTSFNLKDVTMEKEARLSTESEELDRVLGGGIVKGSLLLLGGDPGIGKSTILLQICRNIANTGTRVLYISGEESVSQIKMRADRIGAFPDSFRLASETDTDRIQDLIFREKPALVVIDSIQTVSSSESDSLPGSVSEIREATMLFLKIAKEENVSVILVGHVTKEGAVAGPKMLEHMVDTVLYFEGDRFASYRVIRSVKNRFGATNEVGIFEMTEKGLKEVQNPSAYLLSGKPVGSSGSSVTCVLNGTRPMLLEIQSLVTKTNFGLPRRTAVGVDYNRLNLLIAVMEKRADVPLSDTDVYVNLTGGLKVNDTAMDLSLVVAIASAFYDLPMDEKTLAIGEVGLTGELRGISQPMLRIKEAIKLGYERIIIPYGNAKQVEKSVQKYCMPVHSIREAIKLLTLKS